MRVAAVIDTATREKEVQGMRLRHLHPFKVPKKKGSVKYYYLINQNMYIFKNVYSA